MIEGNHLIPALYSKAPVDLYIVLAAPEASEHQARLHGESHSRRRLSESDFANVRRLDRYLREEAAKYGVSLVLYTDNFGEIVELVDAGVKRGR